MMLKTLNFLILFSALSFSLFAQIDTTDQNYKAFYNEQGVLISEGYLDDGKPNRYWINYYDNGFKKSEGNRLNFELDSSWIFYDSLENINRIIHYKNGKKNGFQEVYENNFLIKKEEYRNDTIIGNSIEYYPDSVERIKSETPFNNNLKDGVAFHYSEDGRLVELVTYTRGFLKGREYINQIDNQGRKQGIWKTYYDNNRLKQEKRYKDDLLNGYEKNYSPDGKLQSAILYINGQVDDNEENEADFNIESEYYASGNIKKKTTYNLSGKKEGIEKIYNEDGSIQSSALYKNGFLLAEGIVDDKGWYQGEWKHYYLNGELKSTGSYKDGKKIGKWDYYFRNGQKEQGGSYDNGQFTGEWNWYFENGNLLRKENFRKGLRDGYLEEYEINGHLITKGEYSDDLKEGPWFYELNDHTEKGEYSFGERHGKWQYFHETGKLSFEGSFMEGMPDGKHKYYTEDGILIKEENYEFGQKVGIWKWYDELGNETLRIQYKNNEINKINGSRVNFLKK